MRAKETIDIEALLVWAYRDQQVDRMVGRGFTPRGPSVSPASGFAEYMMLGTKVDTSGAAAAALGIRLPEDALIVHDAVLELGDMLLEWRGDDVVVHERGDLVPARGFTLVDDRRGLFYGPISTHAIKSGRVVPAGPLVPLRRAVTAVILIEHARAGTRPEAHEGWSRRRGRPTDAIAAHDNWGRRRKSVADSNRIVAGGPSIDEVMLARALYGVWHAALVALAETLAGLLSGHAPVGPAAPATPWVIDSVAGRAAKLQKSSADNPLYLKTNNCT